MTPQPFTNIRSASTTRAAEVGKIRRPRRARSAGRRKATPLRLVSLLGERTPVTLTLTIRRSSEMWMEVAYSQGRFFVPFDASVFDLVRQVQVGGHWVQEGGSTTAAAERAKADTSENRSQ